MKFYIFFSTICAVVFPITIQYILKRKCKKKLHELQESFNCREHLINQKMCSSTCASAEATRLEKFISSAKKSILMCMYIQTLTQVHNAIAEAHKKGIQVRLILDKVMLKERQSRANLLDQYGIPFKFQSNSQSLMHHKFCLVDETDQDHAKMFFGSTNLTSQALVKNFDCLVMTNNWEMICRFREEFEHLWSTIK